MSDRSIQVLLQALRPFALAAEDYEQPKSKYYRNEEHIALSLTAGDVRVARRVFLAHVNPQPGNRSESPSEPFQGYQGPDQGVEIAPTRLCGSGTGVLVPTFTSEWEAAPRSMTRTTERECAEYWFERGKLAGRVAEMVEITREGN